MSESEDIDEPTETSLAHRWRQLPPHFRWPTYAFAFWIALVLLIQLAAPNPEAFTMPSDCPEDSLNCVRVAHDESSFRPDGLQALVIEAGPEEISIEIETWLLEERGGRVIHSELNQTNYFLHGVDRTNFLFFPDDLYAQISCSADEHSLLTLQSESRLGVGDLGVNHERLSALLNHLENVDWSGVTC